MAIPERNAILDGVITFVTCNIYGFYWYYRALNDLYEYLGQENKAVVEALIGLVTVGIYPTYRIAKLIPEAQAKAGVPVEDVTTIMLVLRIVLFPLGIVTVIHGQGKLNEIATGK